MLEPILIALAVIIVLFIIIVAMRPSEFTITRSATISAPSADVFARVNDFHAWEDWSPWAKIDPALKSVYEGPTSGTGAVYKWFGNKKVGEGIMTITDSHPNDRIGIKLEFIRPFKSTNDVRFNFEPVDGQTKVTWTMAGRHNFMSKAFCMFMNMDKMVGGDFDKGLASMKSIVETAGKK